jgi:hypothetical protein
MRKFSILLVVALVATSCAVGTYHPYARNNFGAQSTVVLDKANFRVVRDVEAIVDVNNTRLSRADVASSAYGELLRKAQLTGSQVLINVVIEEVRRETGGFFRWLFGIPPKRVQHVAARATIIEFLDENGNPTVSQPYHPSSVQTDRANSLSEKNDTLISITEPINLERENAEQEYNMIISKLNRYGWQKSVLSSSYKKAFNYLIVNERLEDIKKVNKVLIDIFDNKLIKSNVEKQLKTDIEKGIPEYQTFLQF